MKRWCVVLTVVDLWLNAYCAALWYPTPATFSPDYGQCVQWSGVR
jgi:hypothetical protein